MLPGDDDIENAAETFRAALDAIDKAHWDRINISNFPRGACGHCAELLARYLSERFEITPDYVCKDFYHDDGEWITGHAWLEWNGLVIDISGDQLGWPPVIVSRHSAPHMQGKDNIRHPFKLDPVWWSHQCTRVWHAARPFLKLSDQGGE